MSNPSHRAVWVTDDDLMSREVATLLLTGVGFAISTFDSGEATLAAAGAADTALPEAMLIDMQMPGLTGDALAARLRPACGPATRLVAMSGSFVEPARRQHFDCFLMKPFSAEQVVDLLGCIETPAAAVDESPALAIDPAMVSETTFASLRQTMSRAQLRALYAMCLDDAEARLRTMQLASEARDAEKFRAAAHSIKGGCGMVGAIELARIAADFERQGLPAVHTVVPFQQFLEASARLRGMLERVLDSRGDPIGGLSIP